jgi:hypothetical protein
MGNTERTHYKVVSSKRPLCIGEENDMFLRKLDNDFLSRETPDKMIYYNTSNGIEVQEKRENYFDFSDEDVTFDFTLKGYISDLSTLKTGRHVLMVMYYKLY